MQRQVIVVGLVVAALAALPSSSRAADEPDELIAGKIHIVKPGTLVKLVAKGTFTLPNSSNDPTVEGGSLQILDLGASGGNDTYGLPAAGWKGLGSPAGSKGFKYKGAGSPTDPCKVVLVKPSVIKAVCKGAGVTLTPPFAGASSIVLSLGTDTKRYCALFGGQDVKNVAGLLKRKDAAAPASCAVAVPTTSTTSTSSTTLPASACCNAEPYLAFQIGIGTGDCGDITRINGMLLANVACGGLYFGGGGNSVPLPALVPDTGQYITKVTGCLGGQGAVIGAATPGETGSVENCTAAACAFGAPLPIPNAPTPPTSTCVINNVATGAAGTADCGTGSADFSMPLTSTIYLTGDLLEGEPGIQPCPLCLADGGSSTGFRCSGTGLSTEPECTPDTSDLGDNFPTSYDCFPPAPLNIGSIPIDYTLTTGSIVRSAAPGAGSDQLHVFCGFCRDGDASDAFESPPNKCFENGMAIGPGCSGTFEACEQRSPGAFGPNGGDVQTITVSGSPGGSLLDSAAHPSTLVSIFCIPPTFNATVDAAGDLPGPGAAALQGTTELRTVP